MKANKGSFLFLLFAVAGIIYMIRDEDNTLFEKRLLALDQSRIQTNKVRLPIVENLCKGTSRQTVISNGEKQTNKQYKSIMKTYFKANMSSLIGLAINGKMDQIMSQAQSLLPGIIVYVVPFIIGFVLGLTLWTCLCCCCTCPGCCPSKCCKCCRHDDDILYTKCELLWPSIFLLILLLLAIAASIPGITQSGKLSGSFETIQCGVALAMDNVVNGNVTHDKSAFFYGISSLVNVFNNLKGNLTHISNNITSVNTQVSTVITDSDNILEGIQRVTNPTTNDTNAPNIDYTNPTSATVTVTSKFTEVLGNAGNTSSILGVGSQIFTTIKNTMTTVSNTISSVSGQISGPGSPFSSGLDSALNQFNPMIGQVTDITNTVQNIFGIITPYLGYVKIGVLVFFAVVIGLSVIALLGLILTAFFDKAKCRYLMYFACVFMVILVLLGFLICFIFSFLSPLLFLACQVISPAIDTNTGFVNFISDMNVSMDVVKAISVCFPGGNGQILKALNIPQLNTLNQNIANMSSVMNNFVQYSNYNTTLLTQANNQIINQMNRWQSGKTNDLFGDLPTIASLKSFADKTFTTTCTNSDYLADSLVPSTNDNSTKLIPCHSSTTANISCAAGQRITALGHGCIDLVSCFINYDTLPAPDLLSDMNTKYGCSDIASYVDNLYQNWDKPRRDSSTGIKKYVNLYSSNVDVSPLVSSMGALSTKFDSVFDLLNTTLSAIIDPTYGLLSGLNCLVIGQDIVNAKNGVCVSLFNSIFFLLVTMGITSFAFLFALCCITCTGVRHYKQDVTKSKILVGPEDPYDQTFVHLQDKQRNHQYP